MGAAVGSGGTLSVAAARDLRLRALLLAGPAPAGPDVPLDVATWFGALQGQDARGLLWSLGVRWPGSTVSAVREALERRTVVRTWPMRGTLHLVPARDVRWMTGLMASRQSGAEARRRGELGVTDADVDRAVDVLAAALSGDRRLTRAQCLGVLTAAGVPVSGQAGYHLLAQAAKRGVTCVTPDVGSEQTFALLDDWAPGQLAPERDEALATITLRYLRSHGPAGRRDLAGWTGLPLGDVDRGLGALGDQVARVRVDGAELLAHAPALDAPPVAVPRLLVLPGFDEFVLGYKDRSLLLSEGGLARVVPGGNGMFRSTLVREGRVVGVWTRTVTRGRLVVDPEPFEPLTAEDRAGFEAALVRYGDFLAATAVEVRWPAGL